MHLPDDPTTDALLAAANEAVKHGAYDDAVALLQRARDAAPDHVGVLRATGMVLRVQGDIWGALAAQTRLVEVAPDDDEARFQLAMSHSVLGRPDRALPEVERLVTDAPDKVEYQVGLALVLNRLGRYTDALTLLDRVLASHPDNLDGWLALAEAHRRLQQTFAWVQAVRQAAAIDAESPAVQTELADVAVLHRRPDEAADHLRRALERHPRCFLAHIGIGVLAWNAGDLDPAEAWLESAVRIAPWDGRTQGMLAQFQAETGRGLLDLDHLEHEALALPYGRLPKFLGEIYLSTRVDIERAVRFFTVAVEHAPEDVEAITQLGEARLLSLDPEGAMTCARRAIDLAPEFGPAWSGLGFALMQQGHLAESSEAFARAVTLLPNQANVRQAHGVILLEQDRVKEAVPELRAAADLAPENGKVLFSLARGLEQAGQTAAALDTARQARALLPDDHQIAELAARLEGTPSESPLPHDRHEHERGAKQ